MPEWAAPSAHVLALAVLLDAILGEYPSALHPVVWQGAVISLLERAAPRRGRLRQFLFGALMAVGLPTATGILALVLLWSTREQPVVQTMAAVFLLKSSFALRALGGAARGVERPLHEGHLEEARHALRSLCSRDASDLEPEEIAGAAVESVAENASDSLVAPLLFYALLGLPGALVYRTVNTLDARVGYRGRYEWLGKASARLDDLLNLVPSRLTAALLLVAGGILGHPVLAGIRTWKRDRRATASPNAGHPMSVMAGLVQVRLTKRGAYRLGDPVRSLSPGRISEAWRIVRLAGWTAAAIAALGIGGRGDGTV